MEIRNSYYKWFQKVISVFIDTFFVAAPLASLYLFTIAFHGKLKILIFAFLILVYSAIVYCLKERVRAVLEAMFKRISAMNIRTMFFIITMIFVLLKILFTIFFNYDGTQYGDTQIYYDIAKQIFETGDIHSRAISHLYGLALHFVLFMYAGIPLHVGLSFAIYIGIVFNFFSFTKILGKDKAFVVTMFYVLMPSTIFFTFSPTHEVFVFMYLSIFLFFFNRLISEEKVSMMVLDMVCIVFSTILTCFVNPGGYIIYIIMILSVVLSNIRVSRKGMIIVALLLSIFGSNLLSKYLDVNEYNTTINTYTILIHGVNPNTLGEQEDGYPLKQMRMYIHENTLDFTKDGFVDAAKHVLINHYLYLLSHPIILIRLILHKVYILWSGVHYPIELAHYYGSIDGILYYGFLIFNTLIYLFVLTVGLVYKKKREDAFDISNYKLELLGVIALTLLCIVVNKYSVYVTMFIYLIAFYRAELKNE